MGEQNENAIEFAPYFCLARMCLLLLLAAPIVAQGQFNYITNNGAVTITGYNTAAGLNAVIPLSIDGYPVLSIADYAFSNSSITNVSIPNSVTDMGEGAFGSCFSLMNVIIGQSVTTIGNYAFGDCGRLASVTIGNSVTTIGTYAFGNCFSLTSVTIPDSVTFIGGGMHDLDDYVPGAFAGCASLMSVTIGNSVTNIGDTAFEECSSLTSVTIPNSVTSIGQGAFDWCRNLAAVYFQGNAPNYTNAFGVTTATVYYLPGTLGWATTFDDRPTAPWFLPQPLILSQGPGFGVRSNHFGFTISWATNASVVVEACTNLTNPVWLPVSTNTLVSGTSYFSDPQPANLPGRFYRLKQQ